MLDLDFDCLGDYDVFVLGELLTTFYGVTYGEVLDLLSDFPCDAGDIDVRFKV